MNEHFDEEKTFILVSSFLTWFETDTTATAEANEEPEPREMHQYSEEEYAKRVPHVKYQHWKEVEKLCKRATSDTLHTYCIFAGLQYGKGEDKLHPVFKQAWHLAEEGLPIFGKGDNYIPLIHTTDLSSLVFELACQDAPLEQRYFFGVDEGQSTWKDIITAVNTHLGNGTTFTVQEQDYVFYENIEHFIINIKVEMGKTGEILEEDKWVSRAGLVENIASVVKEYKKERGVEPLRALLLGPPASGKSYFARELSEHYKVPTFTINDIIQDYQGQVQEFKEELSRIRTTKKAAALRVQLQELRQKKQEEAQAAREAGEEEGDAEQAEPPEEGEGAREREPDEDELFDDDLIEELERIKAESGEPDEEPEDDEQTTALQEALDRVNKVLSLREKPASVSEPEPVNPKDKKPPAQQKAKAAASKQAKTEEEPEESPKPIRYSDKALSFMLHWKLQQPTCRNQGYILDGFPKTPKQAKLLFEEGMPGEVPAPEDEEEEPPADDEKRAVEDSLFPDYLIQLKASDTYLTERIQQIALHHPHNNPTDFQRRLEFYKANNPQRNFTEPSRDASTGLTAYLDSALTNVEGAPREILYRQFDVESVPLVAPPPPQSKYEKKEHDSVFLSIAEYLGAPRNYGASPKAIGEEQIRLKNLEEESKTKREQEEEKQRLAEQQEKGELEKQKQEEQARVQEVKEQERIVLEARKEPLKQYLMTNIIPVLTKGIIEVCEQRPEDPIDYLADWLFRHNTIDDDMGI
eukprot:TRINITY_DN41_c3_g1_i1.p1 TRINITY_DN41_c3_g1~~TRINITY_DN41_c3_g1_i1.p1  ORF type:complete len:751 (+),score=180.74 TRINITY_DN41_c3_g1_i1:270-2522(+)